MTQGPGVSCVVLLDKPAGPTSFDMVRVARRGMRTRVGHAGTLDPFATGLLLILIGQATRVSNLLMELPKEYEFTVQFGAVSSTADPTGDIVPTGEAGGGFPDRRGAALLPGTYPAEGADDLGRQGGWGAALPESAPRGIHRDTGT